MAVDVYGAGHTFIPTLEQSVFIQFKPGKLRQAPVASIDLPAVRAAASDGRFLFSLTVQEADIALGVSASRVGLSTTWERGAAS